MGAPPYRIFFDTSAYIAGLHSPESAARELLNMAASETIAMVVSEKVITEIDRVMTRKFPDLVQESRQIWKNLKPEVVPNPSTSAVKPFLEKLDKADAAILCSAHLAKVSAFVTWNTRDFMAHGISALVDFPIVVPANALKLFRKWIEPFLDYHN
ncbi:MAG: PIN domain-containing protein [Candidatus Omnitrophica bacterium]|nr:PIN domain-containing protein [Candidatus Omnitrophota bacterium]